MSEITTTTTLSSRQSSHLRSSIIPLNFTNLINNKLPETHKWPYSPDPRQTLFQESQIPIIDLSCPNNVLVHLIHHACEKWGAFQVTSHGLSMSLLNTMEGETRRLFALPMERKIMALRSPENMAGYGLVPVSLLCSKGLWSEGFTISGAVAEHAAKLWPVGEECNKFCSVVEEYQKRMERVAEKIITLILTSLGLTKDDVSWMKGDSCMKPAVVTHLNSYPICPDPAHAMGMAPHTDSTLVTILYQGNVEGLQLLNEAAGEWVTVPPIDGALVVNIGDLMHILSNGRFRSVTHRAVVNAFKHRISVAYFYGPPAGVEVRPAGKLDEEGKSPIYKPVTWKNYLALKGKHGQKALDMIKRAVVGCSDVPKFECL